MSRTPRLQTIQILGQDHHDIAIRRQVFFLELVEIFEWLEAPRQYHVGLAKLFIDEFQFEFVDRVVRFTFGQHAYLAVQLMNLGLHFFKEVDVFCLHRKSGRTRARKVNVGTL